MKGAVAAHPGRTRWPGRAAADRLRTLAVGAVCLLITLGAAAGLREALLAAPSPAALASRTMRVARQLTCPVCAGQSVADSGSPVAVRMRQEIEQMLREGRSEQEIVRHYVELYGPWIAAAPPASGLYRLAWVAPLLSALPVGGALLWRRRAQARPGRATRRGR